MRGTNKAPTGLFPSCIEQEHKVRYKILPVLILSLTAALTWAAIEILPESLQFPVVEYSISDEIQIKIFKNGESDLSSCRDSAAKTAASVRTGCPTCRVVERCFRGLDAERKKILARDPLATPSARTPGGSLTMTISATDPQMALSVCRQIEQQTALQTVYFRLQCSPALATR